MSNQLQITGGAKVRSLEGVITGTSGVLGSVPLGAANGVATLDSGGKVPVSQLPSSVVTYLGTWNAATNTPTLVNGVGDAGDMYICNVAGTVNFGAGPVTFAVGDWVLYGSGTWQKSNGQNGTVTSVGASITGNAIGLTGSPITTAGTLAFAFAGTSGQYVNGAGNLTTFPTLITSIGLSMPSAFSVANSPLTANGSINVTGAGTVSQYIDGTGALQTFPALTGYVPYTGATSDVDLGTHVLNAQALHVKGTAGAGHLGLKHQTATPTGSANESLIFADVNGNLGWLNGNLYLTTLVSNANTANRSYTFPNASGTLALTSDISYPVTSVFGRTGAVTAQSGDYTTTLVTEGTNLYYTDSRSRAALSFTAGSGAYNSTTGVITIPTNNNQITNGANFITLASLSAGTGISYNNLTGVISSTITQYTDAMARAAISGGTGISYNSTTGVITNTITQYTDALARAAISLTTTGTSGAATYNSTTGVLNIPQYIGGVTSVFGRTGAVVATEGDYTLTQLGDVTITTPTTGQVLKYNGTIWINDTDANTGTVTSVGLSAPTGFSVSGSPVTSSGTLSLAFAVGYSLPTTASQTNWDTAYTNRITSLTTTGSSGAATLVSNTLNIPDYGSALSGYLPLTGGTLTGALTINGLGNRPVTIDSNVNIKGDAGGWAMQHGFIGSSGTARGGFGAYGSADALSYYYVGIYGSEKLKIDYTTGAATFSNNILVNDSYGLVNIASTSTGFFPTSSLTLLLKSNGSTALTIASSLDATFSSSVTATSFVKTSGTSSQFLKADGSVDSTSYQGALTLTTTGTSGAATLVGNTLNIPQYSGGGGGVTSLSAIGSTPNANGATITGSVLNLQPASASFGGVVTTGTQTFAGAKTFSTTSDTTFNGNITINAPSGNANFQMASASTFKWAFGYYQVNNNFRLYNYGTAADAFNVASGTSYFGILTNTIGSALQVNGNAAIGYSASTAAPTNGLAVSGFTSIGSSSSPSQLYVTGGSSSTTTGLGLHMYSDTDYSYLQMNGSATGGATIDLSVSGTDYKGRIRYDNTNNYMTFGINSASDKLVINSSGNVGIGLAYNAVGSTLQVNGNASIGYSASTIAPSFGLAVSGNAGFGTTSPGYTATSRQVVAINGGSAAAQGSILAFMQAGVNKGYVFSIQNDLEVWCESGEVRIGNNAAANIVLKTNNTDRLIVGSTGNIGIGTATIGSKLQVNGNAAIGYSASTAAPTNGLVVAGNMGIGMTTISGSFSNGNGVQFLPAGYLQVQTTSSNPLAIGRNTTTGVMQSFVYGTTTTNGTQIGAIGTDGTGLFLLGGNGSTAQLTLTSGGQVTLATGSNVSAIAQTGYSLTGANAQSLLDLAGTWNTTGNPTAIKLNITNTASGATSNLMDLQVGGVSKFKVDKAGSVTTAGFGSTTAQPWKLGQLVTATVTGINLTGYITIEVNGTQYNLALANLA